MGRRCCRQSVWFSESSARWSSTDRLRPPPRTRTARSRFRSSRLIAGLSTEGNSGVFHTHTESGRIDCGQGRTGTIGVDGRYGTAGPASCQQGGEGWGVFSVTLSNRQFKDAFTFRFGRHRKGVPWPAR